MRRLDEAAAAALGGEYEQLVGVGWTCATDYACERVRDYDRALQWCRNVESSPNAGIQFLHGICRVHYAAVLTCTAAAGADAVLSEAIGELAATATVRARGIGPPR